MPADTTLNQQLTSSNLTPSRRNNDSRKTSGANTPNKEGADTPTTHLSQSFNMQNSRVGGGMSLYGTAHHGGGTSGQTVE